MTENKRTTAADQAVSLIPGGGWMMYLRDSGTDFSVPVVAWALLADGQIVPVDVSDNGAASVLSPLVRGGREFWHPDSADPAHKIRRQHHDSQVGEYMDESDVR